MGSRVSGKPCKWEAIVPTMSGWARTPDPARHGHASVITSGMPPSQIKLDAVGTGQRIWGPSCCGYPSSLQGRDGDVSGQCHKHSPGHRCKRLCSWRVAW